MQKFELQKDSFIELNKLLKILKWVNSGGEANISIDDGEVLVNGEVETRKRKKLVKGDVIEFLTYEVEIT